LAAYLEDSQNTLEVAVVGAYQVEIVVVDQASFPFQALEVASSQAFQASQASQTSQSFQA